MSTFAVFGEVNVPMHLLLQLLKSPGQAAGMFGVGND